MKRISISTSTTSLLAAVVFLTTSAAPASAACEGFSVDTNRVIVSPWLDPAGDRVWTAAQADAALLWSERIEAVLPGDAVVTVGPGFIEVCHGDAVCEEVDNPVTGLAFEVLFEEIARLVRATDSDRARASALGRKRDQGASVGLGPAYLGLCIEDLSSMEDPAPHSQILRHHLY